MVNELINNNNIMGLLSLYCTDNVLVASSYALIKFFNENHMMGHFTQRKRLFAPLSPRLGIFRLTKKRIHLGRIIIYCSFVFDYYYFIILSCLTFLDSSKPIQERISVNHEGLSTPITT